MKIISLQWPSIKLAFYTLGLKLFNLVGINMNTSALSDKDDDMVTKHEHAPILDQLREMRLSVSVYVCVHHYRYHLYLLLNLHVQARQKDAAKY